MCALKIINCSTEYCTYLFVTSLKHSFEIVRTILLNNTYEQQVQGAMDRHAKSKERCMLQVIDQCITCTLYINNSD